MEGVIAAFDHVEGRAGAELLAHRAEQFETRQAVTGPLQEEHRDRYLIEVHRTIGGGPSRRVEREAEEDDSADSVERFLRSGQGGHPSTHRFTPRKDGQTIRDPARVSYGRANRLHQDDGAIGGAVLALGTLPITYPITLLADEPLGYSKQEFLFAPVTAAASAGHFVLGAPADVVDFVFRRAWVSAAPEPGYEYTPMRPPVGPGRAEEMPAATEPGSAKNPEEKASTPETSPSERKQPPESDR